MERDLTVESFLELVDDFENHHNCSAIRIGDLDGEMFAIFESWEQVEQFNAFLNDFEGLKGSRPYLKQGQTLHDKYLEAAELVKANPDHYGYKRDKEVALSHFLFEQHLASMGKESICLDDFGIEWGFNDEYDTCCHCRNEVVRTRADSYDWTAPLYVEGEGYVCDNCAHNYTDYVLDEFKNVAKNIPDQFSMEDLGLVKVNTESYQNGLHPGQDDSPEPIITKLNAEDIDVYFKVEPSQFYVDFNVFVKVEDKERASEILSGVDTYQGFSTSGNCKKALQEASKQMAELKGDGIKYSTINPDGTATSRLVSQKEFIDGIKD